MDISHFIHLVEESWASDVKRKLYSTPLFPGFPWYTVPLKENKEKENSQQSEPKQNKENSQLNENDKEYKSPSYFARIRRHVIPYHYTFRVFVKGRWVGRQLLDIYSSEHSHHSRSYYEACAQQGRLRRIPRVRENIKRNCMKRSHDFEVLNDSNINEEVTSSLTNVEVLLEQGDIILHTVHRHEIPLCTGITGIDPIIIAAVRIKEYGLIIIHKPAGVPTHAGGRYFMNSCMSMLEYVLTPKRLEAWLIEKDPLLQSVVSTQYLTEVECQELFEYYSINEISIKTKEGEGKEEKKDKKNERYEFIDIERLPRPCHRLDKVTSGVLLLGVTHEAARRVGTALTNKTKQMEEVFLQRLQLLREKGKIENEGRVQTIENEMMQTLNIGVRKRYLARVHGLFPKHALKLVYSTEFTERKNLKERKEEENNNNNNNSRIMADGLFIATNTNSESQYNTIENLKNLSSSCGPALLLASPLLQYKFREIDSSEEIKEEKNTLKSLKEPLYLEAATLCQPVRYYNNNNNNSESESLIHCVPFTGRMHQIRMHLSDWGHPIIGDVLYDADECQLNDFHNLKLKQEDGGGKKEENEENDKNKQCDEPSLYFNIENLPNGYRENFYKHDKLCWECEGILPVATFRDRKGSSAVALHAWQYEMNHNLLVAENNENMNSELEEQNYENDKSPELFCNWEMVKSEPTQFVRRQGKTVIFTSPPPLWSLQ